MSIKSVVWSNNLIFCRPLLLLPSIFPSTKVFSNELALHIMWPKYWSFSFSISPSNNYLGLITFRMGFPGGSEVKVPACNLGNLGSIPGSGRFPGEGNVNPLQYSCLENPMDRGAWWATVHEVAKSQTRLSDFTFTFTFRIDWFCLLTVQGTLKTLLQHHS